MIRRNPTAIPMSDADVQDVRELVDKQRSLANMRARSLARIRDLSDLPAFDAQTLNVVKSLGIFPGTREAADRAYAQGHIHQFPQGGAGDASMNTSSNLGDATGETSAADTSSV